MNKTVLLACLLFFVLTSSAQNITFPNPSFEDIPHVGTEGGLVAEGWSDCGFRGETTADIQPSPLHIEPFFEVTKEAYRGKTYLGMVTRDDDTWESVGTRLRDPMKTGATYRFSIHLARSKKYTSVSRRSNQEMSYTTPVVLRVWGTNNPCERKQLLGYTEEVDHINWKKYTIKFKAASDWKYIILEAFYKTPTMFPYNGNLLLDNCSKFVRIDALKDFETAQVATVQDKSKNERAAKSQSKLESANLTPQYVKEHLKLCQKKNIDVNEDGYRLIQILFLRKAFDLERLARKLEIQKYISKHTVEEIGVDIRSLEKLGATNIANLLRELKSIQIKKQDEQALDLKETEMLNNADRLFAAKVKEDQLTNLIKKYIENNDTVIRKELSYCHQ